MSRVSQLTYNIFEFLNKNANYAVLRNYEGLPLNNNSRDIDVLLEKREFLKIESKIIDLIIASEFKVITLFRSERMITYVCGLVSTDKSELVQFDFFLNTSLFGVLLLDVKSVLKSKEYNGAIYHVAKEYEFLDKYMYLKFLNRPYPQKYNALEGEMRQNKLLPNILKETTGLSSFTELESITSAKFKRRILFQNLNRKPIEQIKMLILFMGFYIKNIIFYKGFSIGFTGPDGSGKTTVIDIIKEELKKTYTTPQLFHFRPHMTPNIGEVAYKANMKEDVDVDYAQPHRGKKTGRLSSVIRLFYYSLDYVIGYYMRVRPILYKRSIVVFDRYYTDIIADSRRSSIFLNHQFLYWFGKLFIPKLDYNILLTASKEVILARKQELDEAGVNRINKNLNYLSNKKDYYLVLNEDTPVEAVQKIMTIIFENQHVKNIKRIM